MFFSRFFFFFFLGHSYLGSLGFGTFGIVRVWVPFFFFFENLVWVCDFCVCICVRICVCDFERVNKKSKFFVFVFGFLVPTLVRLKNKILRFLFFGFLI